MSKNRDTDFRGDTNGQEIKATLVESGALLKWQTELERIGRDVSQSSSKSFDRKSGDSKFENGTTLLPNLELIDKLTFPRDTKTPPTQNDKTTLGSQASHDYATRILRESDSDGTFVARALLDVLRTGTFKDQDGNERHFLTQDTKEEWGRDFEGRLQQHPIGTVYQGPAQPGELHMRSVINDLVQKMGMNLVDGQLDRSTGRLVENDPQQVVRFNDECRRAFNAGKIPVLLQIREMTEAERTAADKVQSNPDLRGTYRRALTILTPDTDGALIVKGVNGRFRQTDYIPEPEAHMTHANE